MSLFASADAKPARVVPFNTSTVMLERFGAVAVGVGVTGVLEGALDEDGAVEAGGVDVCALGFLPPEPVAATAITATTPSTTSAPPTARATER